MQAVCLTGSIDRPKVTVGTIEPPGSAPGRIVVEVMAAGVTKMEPRWSTSWQDAYGHPRKQPVVLGLEFAGRISALGSDVKGFAVGQSVLGMTEPSRGGAMGEVVSAPAGQVLRMPNTLSYLDASVLPLAGLTAWQGIVRHGALKRGQRALIHGGAGGVGAFATQIARWVGASVVVTAGSEDAELCRRLGAVEVIDFRRERFEARDGCYDLVFDTVGGDVQERSWGVLKRGGRLITIAGEEADAPDQGRAAALGVTARFFIVEFNAQELGDLTDLVASGVIRSIIGKGFGFDSAVWAFDGRLSHFAGKAALLCSSPKS